MSIVLFDTQSSRKALLPLTYTRALCGIRTGILTIQEKWKRILHEEHAVLSEPYLQPLYGYDTDKSSNTFISGAVLPTEQFYNAVRSLNENEALYQGGRLLAFKSDKGQINYDNLELLAAQFLKKEYNELLLIITKPSDIFTFNAKAIEDDFQLLTKGRKSEPLSVTNTLIGPTENLFIEQGAIVEASVLNTKTGPIYIGHGAEIMENSAVRGPFALCDHAGLKMSAKIYGATTIGPHCKVGGEVNNSVFFAYSNKGHDGFIGNSVIGEWCNLGADTNNSNLKNNYGNVDVWSYATGKYEDTGLQFHGLIMGDHSKSGINTMFNTGTVVGVSANVFGGEFLPKFIPSFSWGTAGWQRTFQFEKALEVAERMMERRNLKLSETEKHILQEIFERDKKYREQLAKKSTL